jgi:hypothetical protein
LYIIIQKKLLLKYEQNISNPIYRFKSQVGEENYFVIMKNELLTTYKENIGEINELVKKKRIDYKSIAYLQAQNIMILDAVISQNNEIILNLNELIKILGKWSQIPQGKKHVYGRMKWSKK